MAHSDTPSLSPVPDGFRPSGRSSGYLDLIGPVFEAGEGPGYRLGLRVDGRHVNGRGFCHGALLSALADVYLGRLLAMSVTPPLPLVTAHLSLDYIAAAPLGAWLETAGQIDRVGRTLAHSSGRILADGRIVLRCAGIFQVTSGPVPGRGALA